MEEGQISNKCHDTKKLMKNLRKLFYENGDYNQRRLSNESDLSSDIHKCERQYFN